VLLKIKSSTEQIVAQFSYLILSELAEVYKSEERHFNLKPSNVLFYKSETGGLRLTLADHNLEALSV
jgi:serine/threonine protein kinase